LQQHRRKRGLQLSLALVAPTVAVVALASTVGSAGAGHEELERQGTIAFLRTPVGGPSPKAGMSLFVIRADGTGLRRLTSRGSGVGGHAWSPDGSRIAYIDGGSLWLVRPDGTGRVRLISRSKLNVLVMAWSPDGTALAVEVQDPNKKPPWCCRPRITEIYVVASDGSGARLLVTARAGDPPRVAGEARDPSWLPQGDEIAYTAHGELRAVRADGAGTPRVITHVLGPPTWSPDGRRVALAGAAKTRYDSIYVMNADGSGLHRLTSHAYTEYGFAWSPGGRRILYGRENRLGIYVIGVDGGNNHRVTTAAPPQTAWGALSWAPDGSSIAYTTDSTGRGDLYAVDANGRNKVQLTRSIDTDLAPVWAPG